jgi:hypothetical protein
MRTGTPVFTPGAVVTAAHLPHLVQHGRDGRAKPDTADVGLLEEWALLDQPLQHHRDLVGRTPGVGVDPPVLDDLVALEQPEDSVGVADVDGEQHQVPADQDAKSRPMSSAGAECVSAPTAR